MNVDFILCHKSLTFQIAMDYVSVLKLWQEGPASYGLLHVVLTLRADFCHPMHITLYGVWTMDDSVEGVMYVPTLRNLSDPGQWSSNMPGLYDHGQPLFLPTTLVLFLQDADVD